MLKFRVIFHPLSCRLLLAAALAVPVHALQDAGPAEDAWKDLSLKALYAAGNQDYAAAEQFFLRAVHEAERFGADDPRVGTTLNSLGLVYRAEKKFADCESVDRRALAILEKAYGDQSIDVGNVNYNIASVLMDQGKSPAALPFLQKSLAIYERQFGGNSLKTASVLCMLGDSYSSGKLWQDAEGPLKRCAQIREADGGVINADLGDALHSLAMVYMHEGKYALADSQFKLAEKIRERTQGIMSPAFADTLEAHSVMLKQMGRDQEADKDAALAAAIRRAGKKSK
jgi:tetratricopeptide (TPR) repeat protein